MMDVTKTYRRHDGTVTALQDVSLSAAAGEFVAVRGPSGCGKTTLLLIAGGLLAPDSGRVAVNGHELYELNVEQRAGFRAGTVGFVFQQFHLVPYLTVLDNVLAPTLALPRPEAQKRAMELLERFSLTRRAAHLPPELSTGERQRTAMARALMNEPQVLLADEPTGNLDEKNAAVVLDDLAAFAGQGGTVLLVTHSSEAAARAGRTLQLEAGTVVPEERK